jgi:hypothetical protein
VTQHSDLRPKSFPHLNEVEHPHRELNQYPVDGLGTSVAIVSVLSDLLTRQDLCVRRRPPTRKLTCSRGNRLRSHACVTTIVDHS